MAEGALGGGCVKAPGKRIKEKASSRHLQRPGLAEETPTVQGRTPRTDKWDCGALEHFGISGMRNDGAGRKKGGEGTVGEGR